CCSFLRCSFRNIASRALSIGWTLSLKRRRDYSAELTIGLDNHAHASLHRSSDCSDDKICAYEFLPCRCFSERRDRIAAFHFEAVESLTGQAGLCVAGVDSRLAGLVVKQEVGPPVAVHI